MKKKAGNSSPLMTDALIRQRQTCTSKHLYQRNTSEKIGNVYLFYKGNRTRKATD